MNTFSLKIIACDRVFYDGPCEILKFPGYDGQMAILAHHEKMTTNIEVGELHFRTPDGEEHVAICSDGLLKERAIEQMQQKQSIMEYHVSRASLARAMARLQGHDRYEVK